MSDTLQGAAGLAAAAPDGAFSQQCVAASRGMETPASLSYEQCVAGIHQAMSEFARAEAGYKFMENVLGSKQDLPLIKMLVPTGGKDADDQQIVIEVDIRDMIRRMARTPDDVQQLVERQFGLIHRYLVWQYTQSIQKLNRFSGGAAGVIARAAQTAQPAMPAAGGVA